ncbi:hypothetical protein [Kordia zhangzhouensis]|uniref:hypothetical protein n=1 Tax=Kordia zhangzhouensis TaxID=1620405 RepID=UPI00062900AE|nr:hypothetical protein [Kordia zhangzhouensis]
MKKLFFFYVLVIVTFTTYSQNLTLSEKAEDVGKNAMPILKQLDHISDKEFIHSFITIEKLKEFVSKKLDSTNNEVTQQVQQMDIEKYRKKVVDELDELKEKGKEYGIIWNAIEYVDFSYNDQTSGPIKGLTGKLLFKHKEIVYRSKLEAIVIDEKYALIILRNIQKEEK